MSSDANNKLRDQFAGLAMQAIMITVRISTTAKCQAFKLDDIGVESYRIADIMMAAKGESEEEND